MKSPKSQTSSQDKNYIHTFIHSYNHSKSRAHISLLVLYTLITVFILILSACDKGPPIQEEKFIKVYVDLLIVQDTTTAETFSLDSIKTLVFKKHNVSSEQYDETINYYNSRPEKWAAFFDSATVYVERLKLDSEKKP